MTDLGDLKEQKCVPCMKGMNTHAFEWSTLMAAVKSLRERDVF